MEAWRIVASKICKFSTTTGLEAGARVLVVKLSVVGEVSLYSVKVSMVLTCALEIMTVESIAAAVNPVYSLKD